MAIDEEALKMSDWQTAKKIEDGVCFGIDPADYNITQAELRQINKDGGIIKYVQEGNKLPSIEHVRAYQNAMKNFCKDRNLSVRNDKSTFRGESSVTFFNQTTQQVVIFDRETKIFITAYKLSSNQATDYLETGKIGE